MAGASDFGGDFLGTVSRFGGVSCFGADLSGFGSGLTGCFTVISGEIGGTESIGGSVRSGGLASVKRALELDPNLATAHIALAEIESDYNWDWEAGEIGYKRALELARNLASVHHSYSEFLARMGRFEESALHSELAQQLDPTRINYQAVRGLHYFYEHRFDETAAQCEMVTEKDPNAYLAWLYLSVALGAKGNYAEATEAGERARRITGGAPSDFFVLGANYALSKDERKTDEILVKLHTLSRQQYTDPFFLVVISGYRGDKDKAFAYMEKSYAEKSYWMTSIKVHPVVDSLRSDARFAEMLQKMNLND